MTTASVLMNRLQAKARVRHLQVLSTLGESRSLKRTAEAIGLSQPAVTQLLADLEQLLEVKLFERHARGVQPTLAGRELLPIARRILDAVGDGSETISALRRQGEGTVRVAAIAGAIAGLLVKAVPLFARAHPHIQLSVVETGANDWGVLLARGEVDVAACREPLAAPAGHRFHPVLADHFVIACGLQHPLAGRQVRRWSTLARETWLPSTVGSSARTAFDEVMAPYADTLTLSPVVTRVSQLTWALLQTERLLTLVPYGVVRQLVEAGQLALVEPPHALPFRPVGLLAASEGQSVATRVFLDFITSRDWGA